jgi:Protein of unknown function (DUF3108)
VSLRGLLPLLLALGLLAVGCRVTSSDVDTEDIVEQVPWSDGEVSTYELEDDDGDSAGEGTLSVVAQGGESVLAQDFFDEGGNSDCWRLTAGAEDVKPVEVTREIVRVEDDDEDRVEITVNYAGDFVESVFSAGDDSRTEEADLPENAYDSLSEVFLVRTLDFQDGLEVAWNSVFAARPDGLDIESDPVIFEVVGQESIEVPAGEFETWRIEIRGGFGQSRTAWVAVEPPHQLVRLDFDFIVYQLADYRRGEIAADRTAEFSGLHDCPSES